MDAINTAAENCESDYNTSSQSIFKSILQDVNSDLSSFDSLMWIEDLAKKEADFWPALGQDDFSNDYLINNYQIDNGNDSWSSSHEELIGSDYSNSMSPQNTKSSVTSEKTTEENDLPLELTTITLYTEDSKNNSNYSTTINAFEIHNYSCNSRPDHTKGKEDVLENGDGNLNHSIKGSNISRKVNSHKSSKSRPLTDFKLTDEEQRLLVKEGYTNFPATKASLTKQDVKILRKIRRKIRNKRSAQCSRQRKKQYLEDLEKKFEECTNERDSLKQEVGELRKENQSLLMKMQKLISKNYSSHGQASYKTSLFVLIISFLFILMPYFRPDDVDDGLMSHSVTQKMIGTGRNLLYLASNDPKSGYYLINDSEASTTSTQMLPF